MRILRTLLLALFAAVAVADQPGGTIRTMSLKSVALEGNLMGEPSRQEIAIYLPPGYESGTKRYPVLYLLHGIGGSFEDWTKHWDLRGAMDRIIFAGEAPFIVVMPNGANSLGGGFYVDSPVSGNWETFLLRELIPRIDAEYRTMPNAASRGIAGHSMGGFGALRMAMRHPDLFSAVYAMSPCCLDVTDDIGHGNPDWRKAIRFTSREDIGKSIEANDFYPVAMIAMAAAVSPNPDKPPFFVDLPVRQQRGELLPNDEVYETWRTALPFSQIAANRANLLKLKGIVLDYGTDDQFAHIITSTPNFSRELARLRIPHTLDVYDGDHREMIQTRLPTNVLGFFARTLVH